MNENALIGTTSYVDSQGGDEGEWRGYEDDPSSHEFGHIIGLTDQYLQKDDAKSGKKYGDPKSPEMQGDVMAEAAGLGKVTQNTINRLSKPIIDKYKKSDEYGKKDATYETKIDGDKLD